MAQKKPANKVRAFDYGALPTEAFHPRSKYLDTMSAEGIVKTLLDEKCNTAKIVQKHGQKIASGARLIATQLTLGGRLIYVGAGTSGRLGVLDAAECIPTFSASPKQVTAIIAGGTKALTQPIEGAEDDTESALRRMRRLKITPLDVVCGIAASGVTPFVRAALHYAEKSGAKTIFITCGTIITDKTGAPIADVVIALNTGPEVIAGSTRLKAGTATKLVLNALSSTTFVRPQKTYGGLMVDLIPATKKLEARAIRMVQLLTKTSHTEAKNLLAKSKNVKVAVVMHYRKTTRKRAQELLNQHRGSLRAIIGNIDYWA